MTRNEFSAVPRAEGLGSGVQSSTYFRNHPDFPPAVRDHSRLLQYRDRFLVMRRSRVAMSATAAEARDSIDELEVAYMGVSDPADATT
jgi:hypothetical protein